jgi:predicted nicotinamide N-methyase
VRGRSVLDFGCGSGLVAIAAAEAGATPVSATDLDAFARAATALNAAANAAVVTVLDPDAPLPHIDLVLAGDVFYNADVAALSITQLDRFRARGIAVLVGDPGRRDLPRHLLTELARYEVAEFGSGRSEATTSAVYRYRA